MMSKTKTYEIPIRKLSFTKINDTAKNKREGLIGWEYEAPQKGSRYKIYLGNGNILKTSPVKAVSKNFDHMMVKTENSIYKIKYL